MFYEEKLSLCFFYWTEFLETLVFSEATAASCFKTLIILNKIYFFEKQELQIA